jgi:flagellar basal-body rod modification protein FlgD
MAIISPVATDASGNAKSAAQFQSLGKDDFLKLLVNKLKYQDPLNPMQDEDFVAQLAQFSSLEQMYNIADGIAQANDLDYLQTQSINNTLATNLIGKEVLTTHSGLYFDGESSSKLNYELGEYAETVTFSIYDETGNLVGKFTEDEVAEGTHAFVWDGRDTQGNLRNSGVYSVEVDAVDASGDSIEPSLSLVVKVESISYRDGVAYLRNGGLEISLGEVLAIGEEGAFSGADGDSDDEEGA